MTGIVADDGEYAPGWLQRQQDRELQAVLVDHDVVEAAADLGGEAGIADATATS